jgi:hypothetical protein
MNLKAVSHSQIKQHMKTTPKDGVNNTPHASSCACAECRSKRVTLAALERAIRNQGFAIMAHHINGILKIDAVKPLGFGTSSLMVQFASSNDWTVIDPTCWEIR